MNFKKGSFKLMLKCYKYRGYKHLLSFSIRLHSHSLDDVDSQILRRFISTSVEADSITRRLMRAWSLHQYGSINDVVLTDTARLPPLRKPTDVMIEIHAASVNPIDIKMLGGYGSQLLNICRALDYGTTYSMEFPLVLGRDFSGVVIGTGCGVKHLSCGDEVWGALWPHRQGTHSEYCIVPMNSISKKPRSLSHVEAASVPYAGLTAYAAICLTGNVDERKAAGMKVLVAGGSGGVGTLAIQLLKSWGATVISICSTDAIPLLIAIGADTVIDYKTQNVEDELKVLGSFDLIIDGTAKGGIKSPQDYLSSWKGAKYVTITPPLLENTDKFGLPIGLLRSLADIGANNIQSLTSGISYRWAFFVSNNKALDAYAKLIESGKVSPVIDSVFPFDDLPSAYEKVDRGHLRGKVVIDMRSSA